MKTLEKEFAERLQLHKVSTCMSILVYELEQEAAGKVNIPTFLLKDKIEQEAMQRIIKSAYNNTFNTLYEECWEEFAKYVS